MEMATFWLLEVKIIWQPWMIGVCSCESGMAFGCRSLRTQTLYFVRMSPVLCRLELLVSPDLDRLVHLVVF